MSHLGTPPQPPAFGAAAPDNQPVALAAAVTDTLRDLKDEARAMNPLRSRRMAEELRAAIGSGATYLGMIEDGTTGGRTHVHFRADIHVWIADGEALLARLRFRRLLGSVVLLAALISVLVFVAFSFKGLTDKALGLLDALPMAQFLPWFLVGLAAPYLISFAIGRQRGMVMGERRPSLRAVTRPFTIGLLLGIALLAFTVDTRSLTNPDGRFALALDVDVRLFGLACGLLVAYLLRGPRRVGSFLAGGGSQPGAGGSIMGAIGRRIGAALTAAVGLIGRVASRPARRDERQVPSDDRPGGPLPTPPT